MSRESLVKEILSIIQKDVDAPLRETEGKNRSARIDSFNQRTGAPLGSPYCASGGWCAIDDACKALGLNNPVRPTASSQAFRDINIVPLKYMREAWGMAGDAAIFQSLGNPKQGHYAVVSEDQEKGSNLFKTLEYNTDGSAGSRDGDGAYARIRSTINGSKENNGKLFVCFVDIPGWILDHNSKT